jgi:hypothetical protein
MTVDVLRPVPVGELEVLVEPVRSGRRSALTHATLIAAGEVVMQGSALQSLPVPRAFPPDKVPPPPPLPPASRGLVGPPGAFMDGYMSSVDWRFTSGTFGSPGPGSAWATPLIPLLPDEELTGLQRALVLADSGSGLALDVDLTRFLTINLDLTLYLQREPEGAWLHLDAVTLRRPGGASFVRTTLSDQTGRVGMAVQTMLVQEIHAEQPGST